MKCIGIAFVVGIYDGIYGPGTGTFLMLLFTAFCHLSLNDAAGNTKAINLTTNISALAVFLFNGAAYIPLGKERHKDKSSTGTDDGTNHSS